MLSILPPKNTLCTEVEVHAWLAECGVKKVDAQKNNYPELSDVLLLVPPQSVLDTLAIVGKPQNILLIANPSLENNGSTISLTKGHHYSYCLYWLTTRPKLVHRERQWKTYLLDDFSFYHYSPVVSKLFNIPL
jgi:hypothetical protein